METSATNFTPRFNPNKTAALVGILAAALSTIGTSAVAVALFGMPPAGISLPPNTATANPASPPDIANPRIDKILSLLEAQQTCDSACVGKLRTQADKADALQQVLSEMQTEKLNLEQHATALEKDKKEVSLRLEQAQKNYTTSQERIHQLETLSADLNAARERRGRKNAYRADTSAPREEKLPGNPSGGGEVSAGNSAQWSVLGMTAETVVVSTKDKRVVALAPGEILDGVTVKSIDLNSGLIETSVGQLKYRHN